MKKYIAIGHFKNNENITCVASTANSIKAFRQDLSRNGFAFWVIISEKKFESLKNAKTIEIWEEVKKLTTNYRVWDNVTDYIEQCFDIMEDKMANAN